MYSPDLSFVLFGGLFGVLPPGLLVLVFPGGLAAMTAAAGGGGDGLPPP